MEILAVLFVFCLFLGAIVSTVMWMTWRKLRVIAIAVPSGSDPQAFRFKLTELIRSFGFREATSGLFRAPAWQKWAIGLQDISVEPAGGDAVRVTGPARDVSRIARVFAGAMPQTYTGRQPVGPLVKGYLKMFGVLIALCVVSIGAAVVFAGK